MSDDSSRQKDIIALKIRCHIPRHSAWGVMLVYLDVVKNIYKAHFAIIVTGQDISKGNLEMRHYEMADFITKGLTTSQVQPELQSKLKYNLESKIGPDLVKELMMFISGKNIAGAENLVKKSIEAALATDRIECQLRYEMITKGELSELQVEEEIGRMTFAKKIDIVMPYADNNHASADRIVRENEKDLALVKFKFKRGGSLSGCGMIVCSISGRKIHSMYVSAGPGGGPEVCELTAPVVDFFAVLMNGVDSPVADRTEAARVEAAVKKLDQAALNTLVSSKSAEPVARLLSAAITGAQGEAYSVDATVDTISSLRLDLLLAPVKNRNAAAPGDEDKSELYRGLKIIKASFILSPTKGSNVSGLKVGDQVQVVLDAANPLAVKILKGLNLYSGRKALPMGATVHSIKYQQKEGYKVFVKIAEGVLGKIEEEQDVKVKTGDPVVEQMLDKSPTGLVLGIVAAVVVLVAVVLLYIFL